ncbi:nodulin-26 [Lunatimonas lonarensis]|uniref:Nodulin-26 n=1 Tax=Lunatimonas lonarensis TaxID=1232681 RepID=R7ZQW9_9BACT|nr:GDSL-type esterase/lipase family protein [Lunatimonas lonarensis]EON76516.1 nodulin-26 [Lunatimonas lonarensis]
MQTYLAQGRLLPFLFAALLVIPAPDVLSQTTNPILELKTGDRIIILGNALAENEQFYNYLEFGLSRHWPEQSITFRNLGWSGDNVFGDARSYYTSPPSPYELLMSQISEANPTHAIVAYGGVEAHDGVAGLEKFAEGLEKLLAKFEELGSKVILLSPIPQFGGATPEYIEARNRELQRYADKIAQSAQKHGGIYIDLMQPFLSIDFVASDDGLHLNEAGYYFLSEEVEKSLGLSTSSKNLTINPDGTINSSQRVFVDSFDPKNGRLSFRTEENLLPKPLPKVQESSEFAAPVLTIKGLKKGFYELTANGEHVASASSKAWAEGVPIHQGGNWKQSEYLRRLLNRKDEVFFFKYRPLNRTYIIGFREYEQGRHRKDLDDFDIVLTWLQGQITEAKKPTQVQFKLSPIP